MKKLNLNKTIVLDQPFADQKTFTKKMVKKLRGKFGLVGWTDTEPQLVQFVPNLGDSYSWLCIGLPQYEYVQLDSPEQILKVF